MTTEGAGNGPFPNLTAGHKIMMGRVMEAVTGTLRDGFSLFLLGIGVQFSAHEYIGGLFMALAGAAISRSWEKEMARKNGVDLPQEAASQLFLVVATAFFVATVVSIMVYSYFPGWSAPVVMAASGFASRRIVYGALNVVDGVARRGDSIAQRLINKFLPEATDKDK